MAYGRTVKPVTESGTQRVGDERELTEAPFTYSAGRSLAGRNRSAYSRSRRAAPTGSTASSTSPVPEGDSRVGAEVFFSPENGTASPPAAPSCSAPLIAVAPACSLAVETAMTAADRTSAAVRATVMVDPQGVVVKSNTAIECASLVVVVAAQTRRAAPSRAP